LGTLTEEFTESTAQLGGIQIKENQQPVRNQNKNRLQLSAIDLDELKEHGAMMAKAADMRFDVPAHVRRNWIRRNA
jgi:hypothetical protein